MTKKKRLSSGNARRFDLFKDKLGNYNGLTELERELQLACDRVINDLHQHPPRVTGWLKGGIDSERMMRLKEQYENPGD